MFGWDPWALEPGFPHRRVLRAGTVITAVTVVALKHIGNAQKRVAEATVAEPARVNA